MIFLSPPRQISGNCTGAIGWRGAAGGHPQGPRRGDCTRHASQPAHADFDTRAFPFRQFFSPLSVHSRASRSRFYGAVAPKGSVPEPVGGLKILYKLGIVDSTPPLKVRGLQSFECEHCRIAAIAAKSGGSA